jgi:hypothetical protein
MSGDGSMYVSAIPSGWRIRLSTNVSTGSPATVRTISPAIQNPSSPLESVEAVQRVEVVAIDVVLHQLLELGAGDACFHLCLVDVEVADACDDDPLVELVSIVSNEPDNGFEPDVQGAELGTDDRQFLLRAERGGSRNGRIYTVLDEVEDAAGNRTQAIAEVVVPHDRGRFRMN